MLQKIISSWAQRCMCCSKGKGEYTKLWSRITDTMSNKYLKNPQAARESNIILQPIINEDKKSMITKEASTLHFYSSLPIFHRSWLLLHKPTNMQNQEQEMTRYHTGYCSRSFLRSINSRSNHKLLRNNDTNPFSTLFRCQEASVKQLL